jgi:TatD DNase family protein
MIDSHCHLADPTFADDLGPVIARARDAGLERALVVLEAGNADEAAQMHRAHQLWPALRATIGVHPHSAHEYAAEPQRAADVVREQVRQTPVARAVGEAGLDYHYDHSPRDVQQSVFRVQVRLARELGLPIVVHTRDADADTIDILRTEGQGTLRGVLHCFSGTPALAKAALDLGFYLSLAGIVTFHRAADLRETARTIPLDRLLIETDSPFLAPIPHRGQRNEPAFVAQVAATLAQIHQVAPATVAERTTANFHSLFRP